MAARKKTTARRGASRSAATPVKKPVSPIIWIALGGMIVFLINLLSNLKPGDESIQRPTDETADTTQPSTPKTDAPSPDTTKPKFEFYTLLSESEVIVPAEALPEKAPPAPTKAEEAAKQEQAREEARKADAARALAILEGKTPPPPPAKPKPEPTTLYYLQAGSFPTRDKADSVRAQILMTGQSVRIEQGVVADKTWHRVLVGPYASQDQVKAAQKTLSASGFNSLLLQQRKGG